MGKLFDLAGGPRLAAAIGWWLLLSVPYVAAADPDPQELADRIDRHLAARWQAVGARPAPPADDAEFLRRAYLDLTGRIPTPRDVHDFLADRSPDKRRRLIDELLDSPRHARHFAAVWRALLLPEASASREARFFQAGFEAWLYQRLRARVGYDELVRELLTTPVAADGRPPQAVFRQPDRPNPLAFFAVKEARPENLAATTTRLFLGIRIECAQCHNHPFARWTREQFWNQAAFFAGIERQGEGLFAPLTEAVERRELTPPNQARAIQAVFLDRSKPVWKPGASPRVPLAEWVTAAENPYFARAAVNRLWGHFFGVGLVEPVDDFNNENAPSHPELLDDLARSFVAARFDLGYLTRALCLSQAYQRTSARTDASQDDPRLFARMGVKGLSAEQLFDSLALAVGYRDRDLGALTEAPGSPRNQFLTLFAPQGPPSEPQTSILQALTLMNGKFVAAATRLETSATLTAVVGTPGMDTAGRVEALYLAALGRKPTQQEQQRLTGYVRKKGNDEEARRLADVFWMLLNSAEFRLNH
jgi:hypothetical protein